jgi:DNA-binding XRE family transcriptional regulator
MISAFQCRRARRLLSWTKYQLAKTAGLNPYTIDQLEAGRKAKDATTIAIWRALDAAGIEFVDEAGQPGGVRLRDTRSA